MQIYLCSAEFDIEDIGPRTFESTVNAPNPRVAVLQFCRHITQFGVVSRHLKCNPRFDVTVEPDDETEWTYTVQANWSPTFDIVG